MSWFTIVWAMDASACLTFGAFHLLIGVREKRWANLVLSLAAFAAAATAAIELAVMLATTPGRKGGLIRWAYVPFSVIVIVLVVFVLLYLRAGRPWLGWTAIATQTIALAMNFLMFPNLNFERITAVRPLALWGGETVFGAEGVVRGWAWIGLASSLIFLLFVIDASRAVWRRGERHRALVVGGGIIFFISVTAVHAALVRQGVIRWPYLSSLSCLGIVAAISYELTFDVLRASALSDDLLASRSALRESEGRETMAINAAGVGLWVWDVALDEVWMSANARSLRGCEAADPIDFQRLLSTVHSDDRDRLRASLEEARTTGGEFEGEYRIVRPDGETRWISAHARAEPDATGKPVRIRGVSIDVTPRKLAEQEIHLQRNELAHLSRVAALGELSASLAHELNQPLAAILFSAQAAQRFLARDGVNPREIDAILRSIVEQDKLAGEVIRRIRTLLKKGDVKVQAVEVGEVVHEALRVMKGGLASHGVTVSTEFSPELPRVLADRVQMEQVFLNLMMNGSEAMVGTESGARRLLIRTQLADGEGVCVSISDHGGGLPPGDVERIFEPFVTTKESGLGLGLAVCRTIVTAHGGRLWAANNAGAGATFFIVLPAENEPRT